MSISVVWIPCNIFLTSFIDTDVSHWQVHKDFHDSLWKSHSSSKLHLS